MFLLKNEQESSGLREIIAANRTINDEVFVPDESLLRTEKLKAKFKGQWLQQVLDSTAAEPHHLQKRLVKPIDSAIPFQEGKLK